MIVVGLTGSIAMGKSETARMLRRLGVPVFDSDAAVHRLYAKGGAAVRGIARHWPEAVVAGAIDRDRLGRLVLGKPEAIAQLEALIHPLVFAAQRSFLAAQRRAGRPLAVLDVPLLFETGGEARCDRVLVASAPAFLQRQRALRRPGMSVAKLAAILARQTPDAVKRRRADVVIETGLGRRPAWVQLRRALRAWRRPGRPD